MSTVSLKWSFIALLAGSVSGCSLLAKKREPVTTETSASATPSAPTPAATPVTAPPASVATAVAAAPAAVPDEAVPASQDFEEEAVQRITLKNYKTEFEALKKQIEAK